MVGVILMAKIPGEHWVCSLSIVTIFLLLTTCKHREKVPPRPQGQRAEPTTNNPFSGLSNYFTNIVDSFWALSELCFYRIRLWGRPAWGFSHVLRYRWEEWWTWKWIDVRHISGSLMVMINTWQLKYPGAFPFGFFATNFNFGEERPGPPQVLSQNGLACYKLLFCATVTCVVRLAPIRLLKKLSSTKSFSG